MRNAAEAAMRKQTVLRSPAKDAVNKKVSEPQAATAYQFSICDLRFEIFGAGGLTIFPC